MQELENLRASEWPVDEATYHADTEKLSHGRLELFRSDRPKYRALYVDKTMEQPEPTEAMVLGSAVHCAVLEPTEMEHRFAIAPACDRRTKQGKEVYDAFAVGALGKGVLSASMHEALKGMVMALVSNALVPELFSAENRIIETPIVWSDPVLGLEYKCKPDLILPSRLLAVDLKTCRDASPGGFARSAAQFSYDLQAAWYLGGIWALYEAAFDFLFIAVETQPPHSVGIYQLSSDAIAEAERVNRQTVIQYATCRLSGDWRAPHEKEILTIDMPRWTRSRGEWDMT